MKGNLPPLFLAAHGEGEVFQVEGAVQWPRPGGFEALPTELLKHRGYLLLFSSFVVG